MFFQPKSKPKLQIEIDKAILELGDHDARSEEYGTIVERLSKLHKMQQETKPASVDPNTALTVGANLVVTAMIIRHEQLNVITTKALSFIIKPR